MNVLKSRWLPLGAFALVTGFIFRDFIFSDAMLYGGDTEGLGYAARAFFADALGRGNFPGWNPFILGGTPFLASLAGGDSLYPLSAPLLLVMETYRALGWKLVLHVFLAGVGMYGWVRCLGVRRWAATIAGLGYLVAPYFVTLVFPAHDGKMFVTALTPFLFWAIQLWFAGRRPIAWAGIGVVVALVTLTTHFQMAYFLFLAAGAYAAFLVIQEVRGADTSAGPDGSDAKRAGPAPLRRAGISFALFVAASVVGVGAAAPQFLPALDYITSDSRRTATTTEADAAENREYAASWSLHPEEAMSLVLPEFVGNSAGSSDWTAGTYWGRNVFKLNHEYLGVVLLLLAAVGFVAPAARRLRWYLLGMGAVALLYALGANTPVWHIAYALLPGVSLFRAASMAIFLTGFAVATLAAFGADRLLALAEGEAEVGTEVKVLYGGAGAAALLFVLAASGSLTSIWTSVLYGSITPDKAQALGVAEQFITRGALVMLLLVVAAAALGWAATQRKVPAITVFLGLALLVTLDGVRVDQPFIQTKSFASFGAAEPMEQLIADKVGAEAPFRLLDMRTGDGNVRGAMFDIELTWGHHANDLARYRELIGSTGGSLPINLLASERLLRLTNTRYVLWPTARYGPPESSALGQVSSLMGAQVETASQLQDGRIYETLYRIDDIPRARLVSQVQVAPDEQAVSLLADPGFPLEEAVVVPDASAVQVGGGVPEGSVEWVEREVDAKTLSVSTDRPSLLVVGDNWYKGWQATVDGVPTPVLRVNLSQQAVAVPAGTHEVVLTHADPKVRTGVMFSLASMLLLFGAAGTGLVRGRRSPSSAEEGSPGDPSGPDKDDDDGRA